MSHRVIERWMDERVETLEDLLRPGLGAVCVGINPAPDSVRAGHYYQGRLGQRVFQRLERAGLLAPGDGWEDDRAFAAGVGFTDIIKRPTSRAAELRGEEFDHGAPRLRGKLDRYRPGLVIFTFPKTAKAVLEPFAGYGLLSDQSLAGAPVFVMPGPYEPRESVDDALDDLRRAIAGA